MQKSLCSLLFLLFLQFSVVYSQDWEPVCEQEICVQSFYDTGTNDINDITNVYAQGFLLRTPGTSGANNDYAAWSNNTTTSFILFSHTGLSAAYEYRVRIYAKTPHVGKKVDFGYVYGNDLSTFQPISSDHSVVQVGSFSSPGAEIISEIFTVSEIGNFNIAILPRGTATTQLDKVMIDDYVLERRALASPTSVYFSLSNASINEGEAFDICLSIANPSNENNTRVEVSLPSGEASPHFTDLTIPEITFLAGSSEDVCFTVTPAVLEMEGIYNFVISSVGGDHNPVIGDGNQHELKVLPENVTEECEWAGEDKTICAGQSVQIGCPNDNDEYCFKWFPETGLDGPNNPQPNASPSSTTYYTVIVTDNNGDYVGEDEVLVTVSNLEYFYIEAEYEEMCADGVNDLTVRGSAEAELSFSWSQGEYGREIQVTNPGTYSVTIEDFNSGCIVERSVTVAEASLGVIITPPVPVFCEGEPLVLTAEPDEEVHQLLYNWSDYSSTATINVYEPGIYSVTVIDAYNGCHAYATTTVNTGVDIVLSPHETLLCGEDDVIEISVIGDFEAFTWSLDGTVISEAATVSIDEIGTLSITVVSEGGCMTTETIEIEELDLEESLVITASGDGICNADPGFTGIGNDLRSSGMCGESVILHASDGFDTYMWSTGQVGQEIEVFEPGVYSVTVGTASNCIATVSYEVEYCLTTEVEAKPEGLVYQCSGGIPVELSIIGNAQSYVWSSGESGSSVFVDDPGEYTVTITDDFGCTITEEFNVGEPLGMGVAVGIELYKPYALVGSPTDVLFPDPTGVGGMVFENFDNDDQDKYFDVDKNDKEIQTSGTILGDDDLMRIRLTLTPGTTVVPLRLFADDADGDGYVGIKIWKSFDKSEGSYKLGNNLILTQELGGVYYMDLWVEGVRRNTSQQGVKLRLTCNDNPSCPIIAEANVTVIGVKSLNWEGVNNGWDAGTSGFPPRFVSNILDTNDPLFPNNAKNNDGEPINSFRVFPGGRFSAGSIGPSRNLVKIVTELEPAPTEDMTLYLKAFDIDDPSDNIEFVDPNDDKNCCHSGAVNYSGGTTKFFDFDEDNRGDVSGKKAGELVGEDANRILSINFLAGQIVQNNDYFVSLSPGDNYRVASAFDYSFIDRIKNIDNLHGLNISDPKVKKNKGALLVDSKYLSGVLTVWRILHLEDDSMQDYVWVQNQNSTHLGRSNSANNQLVFKDFVGIADRLSRVREFKNIVAPTVSLINPFREEDPSPNLDNPVTYPGTPPLTASTGRFENGEVIIGASGTLIINVKGNGDDRIDIGRSINTMLALPFDVKNPTGTIIGNGIISDVYKNPSGFFEYSIASVLPAGILVTGNSIVVDGGEPVNIGSFSASVLVSSSLSIPLIVRDDDSQPSTLLPHTNLLGGLINNVYDDAYLVPIVDGGGDPMNNRIEVPFISNTAKITAVSTLAPVSSSSAYGYNHFASSNQSSSLEDENYWVGYFCSAWQKEPERDVDENLEKQDILGIPPGTTYGVLTPGGPYTDQSHNILLRPGGDVSCYFVESGREINAQGQEDILHAHELGHQFGLFHGNGGTSVGGQIVEFTNNDMGIMWPDLSGTNAKLIPRHINLIRIRTESPGDF